MLVRSAGRRQRRHASQVLAASFAQLNLPWLAPAQLRWSASQAASPAEIPHRRRQVDAPRLAQTKAQSRGLATAADQLSTSGTTSYLPPSLRTSFKSSADKNVPFEYSSPERRDAKSELTTLRPYNDPIIINSTTSDPSKLIKVQAGIFGTSAELLQHLHTNLRVGRFARVEAIIQRLAEQTAPFAPELIHAHEAYLEEHLKRVASHEKGSAEAMRLLRIMQKWIEVEVRSKEVEASPKMLVVMIRACLRAMEEKCPTRVIERYLDWARTLGSDGLAEVLDSNDFDDDEYTTIGHITERYYVDGRSGSREPIAEEATEPQEEAEDSHGFHRLQQQVDDLPQVMETAQQGHGLEGIKRAMKTFINLPQSPRDAPIEEQREVAYARQQELEETSVAIAVDRWKKADEELRRIGISTSMQSKPMGALMWQWYRTLLPLLEEESAEIKRILTDNPNPKQDDDRLHYGPFLELLTVDKIAANTILFIMGMFARGKNRETKRFEVDVNLNTLATGLGNQLEAEAMAETSKQKLKEEKQANPGQKTQRFNKSSKRKSKRRGMSKESTMLTPTELADSTWPLTPKVKLGVMLLQKLMQSAQLPVTREHPRTKEKVTQMQPAFMHHIKYVLGKKIGVMSPNPALLQKLQSEPIGSLIAKRMPMVVEPKPWTGWNKGGYLHYSTPILRLGPGDKSGKDYFMAADRKGDLSQVYAGVTALGKVPWKVHPDVLRVQIEAWNSGEAIANFAPLNAQVESPPEPEAAAQGYARRNWLMALRDIENKKAGEHSKRCFQNFQLEIARAVVNETLYFPHNMDFRGRAYPIPPYLNHMGADNVRGLLVFAEGKELGPGGLRWLKIHLATAAGHDKASLEERVRFTEQHMDDIRDSVTNPLGGRKWWLQSEDSWQTLAACFELTQALDSPDPTKFVSTIPIQQDGTCNGLQHYAALGGDAIGARQVNLEPGDKPADVYTAVAEAVQAEVAKDAAAGNPIAQKLNGRLTRKCVKQPVMTNVYGVTFFGAKLQVQRQLEVLFPEVQRTDEVNLGRMSLYVATKIFQSLGQMFSGAQAIQHWLGQCADRIATCLTPEQIEQLTDPERIAQEDKATADAALKVKKPRGSLAMGGSAGAKTSLRAKTKKVHADRKMNDDAKPLFRSTVVWTTPMRLPVVQPYRKSKTREVKTNLQALKLQEPQVWDPVSKRKQLQAFPPNFIHSLDATHMLLSALKCNERGMTFASIHDSFWTHACDVDDLSISLRDAFVEMHSEDIIGRLREEFQTRYRGCMYLASISAKSNAGVAITEWRKNIKATGPKKQASELTVETERMRLLNGKTEEERERGAKMVTPGSILASEGGQDDLMTSSELAGQALGDMPLDVDVEPTNTDADDATADVEDASHDSSEGVVAGSVMDTDTEALAQSSSEADAIPDETAEGDVKAPGIKAKAKKVYSRKTYVWLPMTFPEVPAKGSFDVTRLRGSQYFFH
ncbi:DNA-directed RNA polymerase [Elasticomyces elasticus]|nr:DNA-directed RNA polymerase [Elasticomyces elasticus]KAK5742539.1 DNA-directed RNA polymerase [Elasticomyces elasticus]